MVGDMSITDEHIVMNVSTKMRDVLEALSQVPERAIVFFERNKGIVGVLTHEDVQEAFDKGVKAGKLKIGQVMRTNLLELIDDTPLEAALNRIVEIGPDAVIIRQHDGAYAGYFSPQDFDEAKNIVKFRQEAKQRFTQEAETFGSEINDLQIQLLASLDEEEEEDAEDAPEMKEIQMQVVTEAPEITPQDSTQVDDETAQSQDETQSESLTVEQDTDTVPEATQITQSARYHPVQDTKEQATFKPPPKAPKLDRPSLTGSVLHKPDMDPQDDAETPSLSGARNGPEKLQSTVNRHEIVQIYKVVLRSQWTVIGLVKVVLHQMLVTPDERNALLSLMVQLRKGLSNDLGIDPSSEQADDALRDTIFLSFYSACGEVLGQKTNLVDLDTLESLTDVMDRLGGMPDVKDNIASDDFISKLTSVTPGVLDGSHGGIGLPSVWGSIPPRGTDAVTDLMSTFVDDGGYGGQQSLPPSKTDLMGGPSDFGLGGTDGGFQGNPTDENVFNQLVSWSRQGDSTHSGSRSKEESARGSISKRNQWAMEDDDDGDYGEGDVGGDEGTAGDDSEKDDDSSMFTKAYNFVKSFAQSTTKAGAQKVTRGSTGAGASSVVTKVAGAVTSTATTLLNFPKMVENTTGDSRNLLEGFKAFIFSGDKDPKFDGIDGFDETPLPDELSGGSGPGWVESMIHALGDYHAFQVWLIGQPGGQHDQQPPDDGGGGSAVDLMMSGIKRDVDRYGRPTSPDSDGGAGTEGGGIDDEDDEFGKGCRLGQPDPDDEGPPRPD